MHSIFEEAEELGYGSDRAFRRDLGLCCQQPRKADQATARRRHLRLEASGIPLLHRDRPAGVDPSTIPPFGIHQKKEEWPVATHLVTAASNFVQAGGMRLDASYTAAEEAEAPDPEEVKVVGLAADVPNGEGLEGSFHSQR